MITVCYGPGCGKVLDDDGAVDGHTSHGLCRFHELCQYEQSDMLAPMESVELWARRLFQ